MAFPIVFNKKLSAGVSNGIAASQSVSANASMVLNGSLTNFLSTTSSAAAAAGSVVIPMTSTAGVTVGQVITDTSAVALVAGTVVKAVSATSVTIWPPVGGVGVGSGDTIKFLGTAILDTATSTNSGIGRRVVVAYTGTDCNWAVTGTNGSGNIVTDTIVGASNVGQSNMDFVIVTSMVPTGNVTAATAGTNGVGSSPWITLNADVTSTMNVSFDVELVSGSANYTVQHTYDDPNNLLAGVTYPLANNNAVVNGVAISAEGVYADVSIAAIRLLTNSGTGQLRMRVLQSGVG